jgi:hypothetical protein
MIRGIQECVHVENKTAKAYVEYEFAYLALALKDDVKTKALVCKECWDEVCTWLRPGQKFPGNVCYISPRDF